MENPLSVVKNTREVFSRQHQVIVTEVQVQFGTETPAWIPLDTLLAIQEKRNDKSS